MEETTGSSGAGTDRISALQSLKARRAAQATQVPTADSTLSDQPEGSSVDGSGEPSSSSQADPPAPTKRVPGFAWICGTCNNECVPIRSESRCLCGHRLKDHEKLGDCSSRAKCTNARCGCKGFFFVVAEGAWVLRCRCKHKHVEHDAATHKCAKAGCGCSKFDSPWVCNCDHPWGVHRQVVVEREVMSLAAMMQAASLQVNNFEAIKRGAQEG
mmetsp:Transcript_26788/g.58411  ORF Transcript_26788/g.58411 Transcript_26788/m.58411 type:complete len:214 (+) Transcript_26788:84-725(+)